MLDAELGARLVLPVARALGLPARGLAAVRAEDLHLTLCFAGELLIGEAREFDSALALSLFEAPAPRLRITAPDAFPSPGHERVLIARVEEPSGAGHLAELVERAEEAAEIAGVALPEAGRPFEPHVTLARVRADRHGSRPRVPPNFYGLDFQIDWTPTAAAWVQSPGGGEPYRVLGEFPLER